MSAKVVRNMIYTHLNKKDYHGHIHQQYTYRDAKSIKGGFEIYHWRACLIVAVPTELAEHLKSAGPERMESVIADFMGEIDEDGVHHCVLLDASDDDLKSMRLKTQEMSGDLYKDGTWDFIFKQYPYAAKVHHFWEPTNTTMQVIDDKTVVETRSSMLSSERRDKRSEKTIQKSLTELCIDLAFGVPYYDALLVKHPRQ